MSQSELDWKEHLFSPRIIICMFTGFSSGMPLFVLLQLVPVWLRDQGVGLAEIGLFALVGIPFTWKFLWAPLMDRYTLPFLGRRRGWLLLSQLALLFFIGVLGWFEPQQSVWTVAYLCLAVAFFSASQDIVIDAYRRELLPDIELGLGNAIHVTTYRVSSLVPGSLALVLADHIPWSTVFWVVHVFMLLGIAMTLVVKEPKSEFIQAAGLKAAVVEPFVEYLERKGLNGVCLALLFMLLYKLGDSMATALATVFYLDMGFSKTDIGLIAKHAALWPAIFGGLLGGVVMLKLGINRALWLFGVVQVVSILGFAVLAEAGAIKWLLAAVISFEYFGVGLGTAAFLAYISRETSRRFAATQFALFSALTALPRTFANASTGVIVETIGWTDFFLFCAIIALPGMLLLFWVAPFNASNEP